MLASRRDCRSGHPADQYAPTSFESPIGTESPPRYVYKEAEPVVRSNTVLAIAGPCRRLRRPIPPEHPANHHNERVATPASAQGRPFPWCAATQWTQRQTLRDACIEKRLPQRTHGRPDFPRMPTFAILFILSILSKKTPLSRPLAAAASCHTKPQNFLHEFPIFSEHFTPGKRLYVL